MKTVYEAIGQLERDVAVAFDQFHEDKSFYEHIKQFGEVSMTIRSAVQKLRITVRQIEIDQLRDSGVDDVTDDAERPTSPMDKSADNDSNS